MLTPEQEDGWANSLADEIVDQVFEHLAASEMHLLPVSLGIVIARLSDDPAHAKNLVERVAQVVEQKMGAQVA